MIGIIGLYGFVWRVRILNAIFWQIYLLFMCINVGIAALMVLDPAVQEKLSTNPWVIKYIVVLFLVINGPLYFALIRYASTKHKIWLGQTEEAQGK